MSGFTIIEFCDDGGVATVPVSWLVTVKGQLKSYWPRKNAVKAAHMQMLVRGYILLTLHVIVARFFSAR